MASPTPREIAMEARKREFDAKRRAANRQSRANLLGMASNPGALLRGALDIPGSVYRYVRDNEPVEIGEDVSGFASDMAGDFRKDPVKFAVDMVNPVSSVQDFADIRAQARDLRAAGDLDTASMLEQVAAMSPLAVVPVVGKVLGKGAKAAAKAATKRAASLAVKPVKAAAEKAPLAVKPLAMDETSRMARANSLGFDKDVYHGTHSVFDAIDPNRVDLGVHVGTPEQAANRLKTLSKDKADRGGWTGANTLPLKVNLGKTLDLPDVGQWNDSHVVAEELRQRGFDVGDIADEAANIKRSYEEGYEWREGPENRAFLDELRSLIKDKGYGSIRYKNLVENDYGELTGMLPHVAARHAAIGDELDQLHATAVSRMPPFPDVGDPNAEQMVQARLAAKAEDYMLPEEAARKKALTDEYEVLSSDTNNFRDPHSYVVLDPARVRSRFAAFDPDKLDSDDLSHAHGGRVSPLAVKRKGKK